jgi:hypothetical protein
VSFVYTGAKEKLLNADLDFNAPIDARIILVMSNTTADTDQDALTISGIGTLDEYNGATYARITCTGETVTRDDANNRAEFDVADFSWATLGVGTRQAVGMILYRFVDGTAANDIPIAYIDSGGFPFDGNGGAVNVTVNAEGILQAT